MSTKQIENRNTAMYAAGFSLAGIGLLFIVVGGLYILNHLTTQFILSQMQDNWISRLARNRYETVWLGLAILCLGTLFKWRAEDSRAALEKTNRYRDYE